MQELKEFAEEAKKYATVKEFVNHYIREAKKTPWNMRYNLTPTIYNKNQLGRVTITNAFGKFSLGVIEPWENGKTTLEDKAYGLREIRKYLTSFYNEVKNNNGGKQ